jgi:hypothetical protein
LAQLFELYDDAVEEQIADPVVVLIDCEDAIGSEIARAWVGDEAVDNAIAEGAGAEQTTTLAHAFSFAECQEEIPQTFPYLLGTFEQDPPRDGFLAVVIASGGACTFTVPHVARS